MDLQLQGRMLVAGTFGRGVWKLQLPQPGAAAVEGSSASGLVLSTFTDAAASGSYSVQSINWGDGSGLDTTSGQITQIGSTTWQVTGSHTFNSAGSFIATVTVAKSGGGTIVLNAAITVTPAALTATGANASGSVGTAISNATVANFTDPNTTVGASSFTGFIQWGDGSSSYGTVTGSAGTFQVKGSHTYLDAGNFTVTTTIAGSGGEGATVTSTATVSGALAMQSSAFSPTAGSSTGTVAVATFTDTYPNPQPSDYTVTLLYGDGQSGAGTVTANVGGGFTISGSNTYGAAGVFPVTVNLSNIRGATASAPVHAGGPPRSSTVRT
jgi:hypothetical protein